MNSHQLLIQLFGRKEQILSGSSMNINDLKNKLVLTWFSPVFLIPSKQTLSFNEAKKASLNK